MSTMRWIIRFLSVCLFFWIGGFVVGNRWGHRAADRWWGSAMQNEEEYVSQLEETGAWKLTIVKGNPTLNASDKVSADIPIPTYFHMPAFSSQTMIADANGQMFTCEIEKKPRPSQPH